MDEWVTVISTVGFPIAACAALFWWINTTLKELQRVISTNTEAVNKLIYKLDKEDKNV